MEYKGTFVNLVTPQKIEFTEMELYEKDIGSNEIIAKTILSAISPGTELAAYMGQPPLRPSIQQYPRLLGYCNVARVVAVGRAVKDCRIGDRVLTCQSHRSMFKIYAKEVILKIPEAIDSAEIAALYLYHLGYKSLECGEVASGTTVAVIGLGPIGLGIVRLANIRGAAVTAVSGDEKRLRRASEMGAQTMHLKHAGVPVGQCDVVITTSNSWDDWLLALRLAGKGGTVVVVGFPGRGMPLPQFNPLDPQFFYDKQLTIKAAGNAPDEEVQRNC